MFVRKRGALMASHVSKTGCSASYRAVVVDDSAFMQRIITDILEDGGIDVVATAKDGVAGVDAVKTHDPDVVTMDIEMPRLNGIEAVEQIMAEHPTPVLMLSAHTEDGSELTFEALEKGAVDFFTKPGGEVSVGIGQHDEQLIESVRSAARADLSAVEAATRDVQHSDISRESREFRTDPTLIIGASTGGPNVVERLLGELPAEANFRILVVQHMPDEFTGRFADRLDRASSYDVTEAVDGGRVRGGEAVVAKGGYHLIVSGFSRGRIRIGLTESEPVNGVRPAIDVTMTSAAETVTGPMIGVVLTGMGSDGADGVRRLDSAGASIIAQDEDTSTVFGMPKRAIETGVVDGVYPINELTDAVLETITSEGETDE